MKNRHKIWVKQGRYTTLGIQGKKGIPMILVLTEKGTTLEPLYKTKTN
jgi:hypothetical protein